MLKRNLGSALRARHHHSQVREIRVRVLTHNVMILIPPHRDVLYRAVPVPIFPRAVVRLWEMQADSTDSASLREKEEVCLAETQSPQREETAEALAASATRHP